MASDFKEYKDGSFYSGGVKFDKKGNVESIHTKEGLDNVKRAEKLFGRDLGSSKGIKRGSRGAPSGGRGFTGKVEQVDKDTGEVQGTVYVYDNKTIGRIRGRGSSAVYAPSGGGRSYNLTFSGSKGSETVRLSPGEANIESRQYSGQQDPKLGQRIEPLQSFEKQDTGTKTIFGPPVSDGTGVPTFTREEARRYGIDPKRQAVWITDSETPSEALLEGQFVGSTPYTSRAIKTKDLEISNLANIRTSQRIYQASKQGMSVEPGPIYAESVRDVRQEYKDRPLGERSRLFAAGVGQGVSSVVLRTGEFGATIMANMGTRTGTPEQLRKNYRVQFGGSLGEIANYPVARSSTFLSSPSTYIKESLQSPSTLGGATVVGAGAYSVLRNIGRVGVREGVMSAVSQFSPLRLQNRIYGASLGSQTKLSVQSIKYKNPATGVTQRFYEGTSSTGVKVGGREAFITSPSGQTLGGGVVVTRAPYTEIRAGGSIVQSGTRTTIQPYSFQSIGGQGRTTLGRTGPQFTQTIQTEFPGGVARVATSRGVTIYRSPTDTRIFNELDKAIYSTAGGFTSSTTTPASRFVSGRGRAIYKTESGLIRFNAETGGISRDFIYKPSGRYRVTPQISGRELDLNKLLGGTGNKGFTSFRGGRGSGLRQVTTQEQLPQVAPAVQAPKTRGTGLQAPRQVVPRVEQTAGAPNIQIQQPKPITQPRVATSSTVVLPAVATSTTQTQRSRSRQIFRQPQALAQVAMPKQEIAQIPRVGQASGVGQISATRQRFRFAQMNIGAGVGFGSFVPPSVPRVPTIIRVPRFGLSGFGGDISSRVLRGGTRRTGYTPSFGALVFNIGGAYKGGSLSRSGLDFRPIVTGFRFKTGLGRPRFNL